MATEKNEHEGFTAEVTNGLLHVVHEAGEDWIDPARIVNVGMALMGDDDGEDVRLVSYVIIDGADEQLDVPGVELDALAAAWVQARGKGGK
jgi:hypothetical protein